MQWNGPCFILLHYISMDHFLLMHSNVISTLMLELVGRERYTLLGYYVCNNTMFINVALTLQSIFYLSL